MMKKTSFALLLTVLVCAAFAGCNVSATSSAAEVSPSVSEEPSQTANEAIPDEVSEEPLSQAEENAQEAQKSLGDDELVPILGSQIADGTYAIEVSSSSSMFRVVDAQLTVANGEMTAVLTLSGTGYEKLYMGTGEEALGDADEKCIYYVEDGEDVYTYEVPVAALDMEIDVAAFSIRKQTWYDRVLVFHSADIPGDAITA